MLIIGIDYNFELTYNIFIKKKILDKKNIQKITNTALEGLMEKQVILAVDIGGAKYAVGLVRENGTIICKKRYSWRHISEESVIAEICTAMQEVIEENPWVSIKSVGITITGLTDPMTGIWISASFMGIYGVPIGRIIKERFGYPVYIENDCNASAVAERMFGLCKKTDHFIYISVSNGIGGALCMNGRLYRGAFGMAGEIGNCCVEEGIKKETGRGRRTGGKRDTLESFASGRGLVKTYLNLGGKKKIDGEVPDGISIAKLAREGDPIAMETFDREGKYLGQIMAACCLILNPEKIIIGGGVSMSFELFKPSLLRTMEEEKHTLNTKIPKIQASALGYDGGLLGAAAIAACELDC